MMSFKQHIIIHELKSLRNKKLFTSTADFFHCITFANYKQKIRHFDHVWPEVKIHDIPSQTAAFGVA
jgi:hypothetical protein